jgi:hypothetical protein
MRIWTVIIMTGLTTLLPLVGCLESTVTNSCTAMAESRCNTCYTCQLDADGLSGAALCGVAAGSTEAGCAEMLTQTCESQSNARQLTNDELDACDAQLTEQTSCTPLYETATQGHQSLPSQCRILF